MWYINSNGVHFTRSPSSRAFQSSALWRFLITKVVFILLNKQRASFLMATLWFSRTASSHDLFPGCMARSRFESSCFTLHSVGIVDVLLHPWLQNPGVGLENRKWFVLKSRCHCVVTLLGKFEASLYCCIGASSCFHFPRVQLFWSYSCFPLK